MNSFELMNICDSLKSTLKDLSFIIPTPIQKESIPHALEGRDVVGSANTGTGKTLAFALPLLTRLFANKTENALVLAPTRELAMQVLGQIKLLTGKRKDVRTCLLIGGDSIKKQFIELRNKPRIIVGTPGRINDHLLRGTLDLSTTRFVVLDETDRMLDMGFSVQIDKIMDLLPEEKQVVLFSATMPSNIKKICNSYLNDPILVEVDNASSVGKNIEQQIFNIKDSEKFDRLTKELDSIEGSVLVFVNTKRDTEKLSDQLQNIGYKSEAIHGDFKQGKRTNIIASYRKNKFQILVATDVAARGLDIPHIEYVINYDIPVCPEDYIHRIGRTGRANKKGNAICFVSPSDKKRWTAIGKIISGELKTKIDNTKSFYTKRDDRSSGENSRRDNVFSENRPRRDGSRVFSKSNSRPGEGKIFSERPRRDEGRVFSKSNSRPGEGKIFSERPRRDEGRVFSKSNSRPEEGKIFSERPRRDEGRVFSKSNSRPEEGKIFSERPRRDEGRVFSKSNSRPEEGKIFSERPRRDEGRVFSKSNSRPGEGKIFSENKPRRDESRVFSKSNSRPGEGKIFSENKPRRDEGRVFSKSNSRAGEGKIFSENKPRRDEGRVFSKKKNFDVKTSGKRKVNFA